MLKTGNNMIFDLVTSLSLSDAAQNSRQEGDGGSPRSWLLT